MESRKPASRTRVSIALHPHYRMFCMCLTVVTSLLGLSLRAYGQKACGGEGPNATRRLSDDQVYHCLSQENIIEFATVSGRGLLKAINKLPVPLRIRDSIIEGGLDFSQLERSKFKPESMPLATPFSDSPSKDVTSGTHSRRPVKRPSRTAGQMPDKKEFARTIAALGALHPFNSVIQVPNLIDIRNSKIEPMQRIDVENGTISLDAVGVMFLRPVNFNGSTFEGGARFSDAAFFDVANFVGTKFMRRVSFDSAWFNRRASFVAARFGGTALLTYARFAESAVFRATEFTALTTFDSARFCDSVDMTETRFTESAQLPSILGAGDFDLNGASFPKGANFVRAQVAGTVNLTNIRSESLLAFTSAGIGTLNIGSTTRAGTSLIGATLDFTGTNIHDTRLHDAVFVRSVNFSTAHLGQPVVARDVFRAANATGDRRMADSAGRFACAYKEVDPLPGAQDDAETVVNEAVFRDDVSFRRVTFRGKTNHLR